MGKLFLKSYYKCKILLQPNGFSQIQKGDGKGLHLSHKVSDLRYLQGEYEPTLANWLKENIKKGFSFIDIGANAGYFSLVANKFIINDSQRIIALEPMQANIEIIQAHIEYNGSNRIELIPVAVADINRTVEFSDSPNLAANTYNETSSLHKNFSKIPVQARSLDSLQSELSFTNPVMKIDVEGAELDVLKGAVNILKTNNPEFILATHECHVKGVEKECIDFLSQQNYSCTPINEDKEVSGQRDYLCRYNDK